MCLLNGYKNYEIKLKKQKKTSLDFIMIEQIKLSQRIHT